MYGGKTIKYCITVLMYIYWYSNTSVLLFHLQYGCVWGTVGVWRSVRVGVCVCGGVCVWGSVCMWECGCVGVCGCGGVWVCMGDCGGVWTVCSKLVILHSVACILCVVN